MDQAEQLRNIVRAQNRQRHLARVITVTSGKGGVGKSNVAVNLALQFSRFGKRVVIFDADFGLANIEVMLGIRPAYNLSDVIFKGRKVSEVISKGPENIGFVSGGSGIRELARLNADQISMLVNMMYELDNIADVVIIDTGAGIADSVIDMVLSSSEVLLVATPEPASITDAYALLKTLKGNAEYRADEIKIKMVGNRTQTFEEGRELYVKLNTVVRKFLNMEMEYLGTVPFDRFLTKAVMRQQPVSLAFPNSPSARAIHDIAAVLNQDERGDLVAKESGMAGVFTRMFRARPR